MAVHFLRATVPANPWNNPDTWPTWRVLLPHLLAATDTDAELHPPRGTEIAWLLGRAALYLLGRGEPAIALGKHGKARELQEWGPQAPQDLTYWSQGLRDGGLPRAEVLAQDRPASTVVQL